jgi:hypothetical protein
MIKRQLGGAKHLHKENHMPLPDELLDEARECLNGVRVESFTASPQTINSAGSGSTLSWRIRQPEGCGVQFTLNNAPIPATGTRSFQPVEDTTYTIRGRMHGVQRTFATLNVRVDFPPVPVVLQVTGIQCFDQEDTNVVWPFDTEDDEPYVLCCVLNVPQLSLNPLSVSPPQAQVIKVGPWGNIDDDGVVRTAPANTLWNANSGLLRTENDAYFIVSVVENDNSDPAVVRTITEFGMFAQILAHVTSIGQRSVFSPLMVTGMTGAVGTATTMIGSGGVIDPDDRIGDAQELRLTRRDLQRVYGGAGVESTFSLQFRGDGADYRVHFKLRRA